MNPILITLTVFAGLSLLGVCLVGIALTNGGKRACVGTALLLLPSVVLPIAYDRYVERLLDDQLDRLGSDHNDSGYGRDEIAQMGSWPVSRLTGLLACDDQRKRVAAIDTLGRIGPGAKKAIPALKQHAEEKEDDIETLWIHSALIRIGDPPQPHLAALVTAIREGGSTTEQTSQSELDRLAEARLISAAESDAIFVGTFEKFEGFGNLRYRLNAAQALKVAGDCAADSIPEIEVAARRADEKQNRVEAAAFRGIMTARKHGF